MQHLRPMLLWRSLVANADQLGFQPRSQHVCRDQRRAIGWVFSPQLRATSAFLPRLSNLATLRLRELQLVLVIDDITRVDCLMVNEESMYLKSPKPPQLTAAVLLACLHWSSAWAQTDIKPEVRTPEKSVELVYQSSFQNYQRYSASSVQPWKQSNDTVKDIGGNCLISKPQTPLIW